MQALWARILLVVVFAAAVVGAHVLPGLDATELHAEIRNGMHIIAFALVAAVVFEVLPMRSGSAALVTLVLVAAIGASAEFAQTRVGKPFGAADLVRDVAGAAVYLLARILWEWAAKDADGTGVRVTAKTVSVALVTLLFAPLAYWLYGAGQVAARFPTLLDFEGRWDTHVYYPVNAEVRFVNVSSPGSGFDPTYAEVRLLDHDWSGIKINLLVTDWSVYEYVTLRASITGAYESRVVVTLNDGAHPGHATEHRIGAQDVGEEPVVIRLPIRDAANRPGRPELDPANIQAIHIIGRTKSHDTGPGGEPRLRLDDIRLE